MATTSAAANISSISKPSIHPPSKSPLFHKPNSLLPTTSKPSAAAIVAVNLSFSKSSTPTHIPLAYRSPTPNSDESDDKPREEGDPEASRLYYLGLHALQHRGQEGAGIVAVKDQPFVAGYRFGFVGLAHNGNLVNYRKLRAELEETGEQRADHYSATKGAIVTFTRSLALSLVERGIRVNAVAPGPIWTPLQVASFPDEIISKLGGTVPMNRFGETYEVATSFVFLASEELSSYFTGQVLHPYETMASGSKYPPPQHQDQQPGKEYVMNPLPQPLNPKPYNPSNKLLGKIALVTGGDSGIGRSVCLHFAMEGATVAFTYVKGIEDIDKDETIKLIKESKVPSAKDPIAISADLGYESECQRVVDEFIKEYGTIDILVNNAAVQYYSTSIEDITEERLEKTFR
ncbi:Glucose and ribitol dehydrogenase [Linum perenne]